MEIDIKAEYVELACHFRAKTPGKYPGLTSVRVEPHADGAIVIATDAAWMFIGIDDTGYASEPVNLNVADSMRNRMEDTKYRFTGDDGCIGIRRKGELIQVQQENYISSEQGFPNWRKPIPAVHTLRPCFPATMGAGYLRLIGLIFNDADRFGDILFLGKDSQNASVLYFPLMPSIMVVAMPLDWSNGEPAVPQAWGDRFKSAMPKVTGGGL